MKDRLEEFVKQNREGFDIYEPDPSLFLKINPKSGYADSRSRSFAVIRWMAAAAVIFLCVTAAVYFITDGSRSEKKIYGELYQEIIETEAYYTAMVSQKYNELTPYLNSSPEMKDDLDTDLMELDGIYMELKNDLKENVGNPEVVEAMIQQYRMKVEILEDLLNQLKEKENNHYEEPKKISL